MGQLGITENVYFGQLLGMCDHVTYALGRKGYKVNKYVPYGPVDEVVSTRNNWPSNTVCCQMPY